jgi:hypothetical protein
LIGKIDNDFNISESDWIPRVGAWVIDALSQMKCLPMERKRRTLEVSNRIANFPCEINTTELKVFDKQGCEIAELNTNSKCGCSDSGAKNPVSEIAIFDSTNTTGVNTMKVANIVSSGYKNFVVSGNNIELNFDTDCIVVESYEVATYYDDYFDCEVPYIYDNGLLLEALAWYCLFKYLSRGSKHTVYSLTSPSPVTNPYSQWMAIKNKASISVKNDILKTDDDGWRNFFYNSTFDPRR